MDEITQVLSDEQISDHIYDWFGSKEGIVKVDVGGLSHFARAIERAVREAMPAHLDRDAVLDEVVSMIDHSGLDQRSMFASRVRALKYCTPSQPERQEQAMVADAKRLWKTLQEVRNDFEREANRPKGQEAIVDTLWHGPCETLLDFIDNELEATKHLTHPYAAKAQPDQPSQEVEK